MIVGNFTSQHASCFYTNKSISLRENSYSNYGLVCGIIYSVGWKVAQCVAASCRKKGQ